MGTEKTNIVLIGMPGAGKSTVGVIIAKVMGYEFIDSDLVIQSQTGKLLSELIETEGLEEFISLEEEVNVRIQADRGVIATGGSVIYGSRAMEHLKSGGVVVYIKLSYDTVSSRLGNIKKRGVVLKEGQSLMDLYEERCPLYEAYADITVDGEGKSAEQLMAEIVDSVEDREL